MGDAVMSWDEHVKIPQPEVNQILDLLDSTRRNLAEAEDWVERLRANLRSAVDIDVRIEKNVVVYSIRIDPHVIRWVIDNMDMILDCIRFAAADASKAKEIIEVNAELSKKGGEGNE